MLLSARFLNNVSSVNLFDFVDVYPMYEGDAPTLYFQLVDLSQDTDDRVHRPIGRRYMPASGSGLQVIIKNIDDQFTYTKTCSQPFPTTDPSIWSFVVSNTDHIKGTPSLTLVLTEGAVVRRSLLKAPIRIYPFSTF